MMPLPLSGVKGLNPVLLYTAVAKTRKNGNIVSSLKVSYSINGVVDSRILQNNTLLVSGVKYYICDSLIKCKVL